MSTIDGNVKDFRPQALGGQSELIFTPYGPATTTGKSLLVPKEIRVSPASDGSFTVDLASWASTNPRTAYRLRVEWTPAGQPFPFVEEIPWPIIVTGTGALTDMFAIEVGDGSFLVKGDKGEDGNILIQAQLDAFAARLPQVADRARWEITDLDGRLGLSVNEDGSVNLGDTRVVTSEGFQVTDLDGYVALEVKFDGKTYVYDPAFGAATASPTGTPVDTLHVFLALGQSNMSGRGLPVGTSADVKDPRILQYGATRATLEPATVPLDMRDTASGLSPATTFARNYVKMQPANVGALIIPAAYGGTGFTAAAGTLTWTVGAASAPQYDLPALAVAQALAAIETARAAGYVVVLKGILWHQGENNGSTSQIGYSGLLDDLIAYLRAQLGSSKLPFVVGQMSPEGIALTTGRQGIDKAHSGTPARTAYAGFAPAMTGGTNDGDTTHFSRMGVEYLGKSMLAAYWQAVGNVLTAAPQPPVKVTATKAGTTVKVGWAAAPAALTKEESFDLATASAAYSWSAPPSHVTGYRVESKTGAGAWVTKTRDWDMALEESLTVAGGTTQVRVTALNGATESAPVTVTALGA